MSDQPPAAPDDQPLATAGEQSTATPGEQTTARHGEQLPVDHRELFTPENIKAFLGDSFPGHLGIEPLEVEDTHAEGRIVVDGRHLHPGGYVHGGVWTALGDTVAAWATFRNIPPGHNFTTIELKLNVFAAGLPGDEIVATGEPLHVGKSTVVIEVKMKRLRDGDERLAANLIVTQFVLPPASS